MPVYSRKVRTLASILQGETNTYQGFLAVGSVLQNRAATNFSGYGNDVFSQAIAPKQFSAYPNHLATPSQGALDVAQQLENGTAPNILPNSFNYASQSICGGGGCAPWANSAVQSGQGVTIGGNTFFKNSAGGTPDYKPGGGAGPSPQPQGRGSGSSDTGEASTDPNFREDQPGSDLSTGVFSGPEGSTPGVQGGGASPGSEPGGPSGGTLDRTNAGASPFDSGGGASPTEGGTPVTGGGFNQPGLPGPFGDIMNAGESGATGTSQGQDAQQGQIVNGMWEQKGPNAVTQAAQTIGKDIADAVKGLVQSATQQTAATNATSQANTQAQTQSAKTVAQALSDNIKDLFVRGFIGFFALVLLGGAVYYFASHDGSPQIAK